MQTLLAASVGEGTNPAKTTFAASAARHFKRDNWALARLSPLYSQSPVMQTLSMQSRCLGAYSLVRPLAVTTSTHHLYLARHESDDESVPASYVAKILPHRSDEFASAQRARFVHECQLLSAFNHPCIPALREFGEVEGASYLIQEYVQGINLAELLGHDIGTPRALPKEMALYVMAQVADALDHIHDFSYIADNGKTQELGAIHRDVCPANVFLSLYGDVVLGDFDAATSVLLMPDYAAQDLGHAAYKAPERIVGASQCTAQSDLFALTVMLWEMLRGERCFFGDSEIKTIESIVRFDISHSSRKVIGLSSKLSEVLRKNLDRDPERRFASSYQILQRLAQAPEAAAAEKSREGLTLLVREEYKRRYLERAAESESGTT